MEQTTLHLIQEGLEVWTHARRFLEGAAANHSCMRGTVPTVA